MLGKEQESKPGGGQKGLKERVIDAGICSGCGACAGLCPYQDFYRDRSVVLASLRS
jgi:coenzyme F420 hydrogenase subunit beta